MNQDFWDSIILITSSDTNKYGGDFGTGFVIHQDEQTTYVLTCAHVVDKVGGSDKVKVAGHSATVEAIGDTDGCDLAVLSVEDSLTKLPPLKLGAVGAKGREFVTAGFHTNIIRVRQLAGIWGQLGGMQIIAREGDRTRAWNLEISDDSEHELKAGYSGSPVVDKTTRCVLGVIAQLTGQGKGLAISIEALQKVWTDIPNGLINHNSQEQIDPKMTQSPARLQRELKHIQNQIEETESEISALDGTIKSIKKRLEIVIGPEDEHKLQQRLQELKNKRTELEETLYVLDDEKERIEELLRTK